ncbi:hypothetical protein ABPG75_001094 [Micractinium tetrahymenae]
MCGQAPPARCPAGSHGGAPAGHRRGAGSSGPPGASTDPAQHNGPAAVSVYFRPQETGASVDGLPLLQASLRGRTLSGVKLPLPAGCTGVVLEQKGGGDAGEGDRWAASAAFSHMHHWNHDAAPLKGDGLRRCFEWAELAAGVHAPVNPAAVAAAAAAAPRQQAAAG